MGRFQRMAIWLSMFFVLAGVVCLAAFLLIRKQDDYFLVGAGLAAVCSLATLLTVVVSLCVGSGWRPRVFPAVLPQSGREETIVPSLSEHFQQRRKMLEERSNIDERRFCAQAQAPCTSWSFCGSTQEISPLSLAENCDVQDALRLQEEQANTEGLPIIRRSGGVPTSCLALAPVVKVSIQELSKPNDMPILKADPPASLS